MIWASADYHFSHENIVKYSKRPFENAKEMADVIIANHNKMVDVNDTVYFLGDFSFHNDPRWFLDKLNGKFIFVRGNHDSGAFFKNMPDGLFLRRRGKNIYFVHDPAHATLGNIDVVLCGHVHQNWKTKYNGKLFVNVGVDVNDFKPVSFISLLDKIDKGKTI